MPVNDKRPSSRNQKSPQQQVPGKDEDRYVNLVRPGAGHTRHAPFQRRRHRHAGAAPQTRQTGRERRDGRRGRPAERWRGEQPKRLPREVARTCAGTLTLRIPKLRSGSFFPDDVIERHRRVDRALVAAVAEMYATGTSTRKVQRVAEKIGVSRLSKDQVSAIASSLDQASRICTEGRSRARQCPTSGSTRPTSRSPLFFEIVFRKIAKAISFQRRI